MSLKSLIIHFFLKHHAVCPSIEWQVFMLKLERLGASFNFGVYWSNVKRTVYLRPNLKLRYEALNSRVELSVLSCFFF